MVRIYDFDIDDPSMDDFDHPSMYHFEHGSQECLSTSGGSSEDVSTSNYGMSGGSSENVPTSNYATSGGPSENVPTSNSADVRVDDDAANASLYIGDLHGSVTEGQLHAVFSQVGHVVSVRIITDKLLGTSLGFGFVNYSNHADAAEALSALNFTSINGKSIRVMFAVKDPSLRKSGGGANLFVSDLDESVDSRSLHDMFAPYGEITSCKVATGGDGASRGHGFVQFREEGSSRRAAEEMDGRLVNGRRVRVAPFVHRRERDRPGPNNVFVKNLPAGVAEDGLREMFGACGAVESATVMRDADGRSRGFGFVSFAGRDAAAAAVESFDGAAVGGRVLYVAWAQRKSERRAELRARREREKLAGANLYMKNIDDGYDEEKLRALFSEFGSITSLKVMVDSKGQSKGFGFVAFSTVEEAQHAVSIMNGKMLGRKPLYLAVAERKEERRARMQAYFARIRGQHPLIPPMPSIIPPPMASMNHHQLVAPQLPRQPMHYRSIHRPQCVAQNFPMAPYPFQRQGPLEMYHTQQQQQFAQGNANVHQGFGYLQHPRQGGFVQPPVGHGLMGPRWPSPFPFQHAGRILVPGEVPARH